MKKRMLLRMNILSLILIIPLVYIFINSHIALNFALTFGILLNNQLMNIIVV